jgi:MFS transporter, DHA1 family, inner membrane transport protein
MSALAGSRMALAVLALSAFVFGTAEFVIVGVLDLVARDLVIPVDTASHLVMSYALGIAVGGPLATALTTRIEKRTVLAMSLLVFVACNLLIVVSRQFSLLMFARFVPGAMHGLFVGVASVIAAGLVPAHQRGQAMSMVFGGVAVATVLGVPLGAWVAQALGWRAAFAGVAGLGALAWLATLASVPRTTSGRLAGVLTQARFAFAPRVLAMLAVAAFLMGGQFSAITYIAPYLKQVSGASDQSIAAYLLAYGIASAVGMFAGGRLADRSATGTLISANVLLVAVLGALYRFGHAPLAAAFILAAWGLVGFGMVPSIQLRVVGLAGPGGDLAASLSASAVNAGIAAGSLAGGWALATHGVSAVVLVGAGLCLLALPATWATRRLMPPRDGWATAEPATALTPDAPVP